MSNRILKKLATGTVRVEIVETKIWKLQQSLEWTTDKLFAGIITLVVVIGSSQVLCTQISWLPDFVWILAVLGYSAVMLVGFYAFY